MPSPVGNDVHCTRSPLLSSAPIQPRSRPVARVSAAKVTVAAAVVARAVRGFLLLPGGAASRIANGSAISAVALTAIARPSSTPATAGFFVTATARAATVSPAMSASLCAPETRWTATSGESTPSQRAMAGSAPIAVARRPPYTAISRPPARATSRSRPTATSR